MPKSDPLKVAIVCPTFGAYGGLEAFAVALVRFLRQERDLALRLVWKKVSGFQRSRDLDEQSEDTRVKFCYVERGSLALWNELARADVVHAQNAPLDVIALARMLRRPLALSIHHRLQRGTVRGRAWKHLAQLATERWYSFNFVWKTWEPEGDRKGSLRVPTIPDLPTGPLPAEERKGFLLLSRSLAEEDLEVIVKAYADAALSPEAWPLHLVGGGPVRESVQALIAQKKIRGIHVRTIVPEKERIDRLRHAKWLVVPPPTREELGLAPLEARNLGVPVIGSRCDQVSEASGPAALLCEPDSVAEFKRRFVEAASMKESEYAERADRGLYTLKDYLVPLSFYPEAYRRLAKR